MSESRFTAPKAGLYQVGPPEPEEWKDLPRTETVHVDLVTEPVEATDGDRCSEWDEGE